MDPVAFLRLHPPFDALTTGELAELAKVVESVHITPGQAILQQGGTPSGYLYVVQRGAVSLLLDGQVYQVLEPGEAFGYPSLLSKSHRPMM
ncbi:MAG: cyclic nucleotide-binding domain-containing protein [Caldilineaceae bacterium]